MGNLFGMRAYLAGQMDRATDGGVTWRKAITPLLRDLGVVVFDPAAKPLAYGTENYENREARAKAKLAGKYDDVVEEIELIRHIDLRMVNLSDFLVVCLDMDVFACGTMEEIFLANSQMKPILIWVPQGKLHAPDWLLGTLPHRYIFSTMEEIMEYLKNLNTKINQEDLDRWVFFDYTQLYEK